MQLYIIFVFIIAFFVAFLAWQNSDLVVLSFLSWDVETPLIVVIIGAATLGSILMGSVGAIRQFQLKMKLRGARKSIGILEKKISKFETENKRLQEQVSDLDEELTVAMANEKDQDQLLDRGPGSIERDAQEDNDIELKQEEVHGGEAPFDETEAGREKYQGDRESKEKDDSSGSSHEDKQPIDDGGDEDIDVESSKKESHDEGLDSI